MNSVSQKKMPRRGLDRRARGESCHLRKADDSLYRNNEEPQTPSGASAPVILFEQQALGVLWRLEVTSHKGRTFANWRKWFWDEGDLKPTRQGITMPLQRLSELEEALAAYRIGQHS